MYDNANDNDTDSSVAVNSIVIMALFSYNLMKFNKNNSIAIIIL